jgi:hypothetical protein
MKDKILRRPKKLAIASGAAAVLFVRRQDLRPCREQQ